MKELKGSPEKRARAAPALRRRKARLKEAGLCQDCGQGRAMQRRTLCAYCLSDRREREATPMQSVIPKILTFSIPLTPPSVNHYVRHMRGRDGKTIHQKTPEARAWERDFPLFARQKYVVSDAPRFRVAIQIFFAPREHGDVDNFAKCVLDCIAAHGMLRGADLKELSDAHVRELTVALYDSKADREKGPLTRITIEAL